jgi:O-antigen ligase
VPTQNEDTHPNGQILHLVVSWMLMIPLVYFASEGTLWFRTPALNNTLASSFGAVVAQSDQRTAIIIMMPIFTLIFVLFLTKLKAIISLSQRQTIFTMLAILALISCVWSQFPVTSMEYASCLAVNIFFAFYLYQRFTPQQQMQLLLLLGWIVIVFSIILSLFFPQYGIDHRGGTNGAWQGMFVHKNHCAVEIIFLLSAAFYIPTTNSFSKIRRVIYVLLGLLLAVMTQARTGWFVLVGLLTYTAVIKFVWKFKLRDRMIVALGTAAIALVVVTAGILYWGQISYFIGKDSTLTGRTDIWRLVMVSIVKRPILGYGYRGFWNGLQGESANVSLGDKWIVPGGHNGFLNLWLDLGGIGLGLFLYSLAKTFKNAVLCLRFNKSSYIAWYLCIVFLTVISNIDESTILEPNLLPWIMYVLACIGLSDGARRIRLNLNHNQVVKSEED